MSKYRIPEIFIKEINLFDATAGQMSVKIKTMIKDEQGAGGWSSSGIVEHMKYLVVISSNTSLNTKLTLGKTKFDKDHLMSLYSEDKTVKIFSNTVDINNPIKDQGIIYLDNFNAQFPKNEKNIKVFCSLYLEMSDILKNQICDL